MKENKPRLESKKILLGFLIALILLWLIYCWITANTETALKDNMSAFTLILWSILLEALPFVLLGTLISSLIQVFVSEDTLLRILPKNNLFRLVFASCIGIIFPVCECAIIPITRGLIKKGMPLGPAIAFMIAAPIVNPIVLLSTYTAFPDMPQMAIYRGVFGFIAAISIGFIAGRYKDKILLNNMANVSCSCGHDHHIDSTPRGICTKPHNHELVQKNKISTTIKSIVSHVNEELQSVGAYLIFGAIIASTIQIFVSQDLLLTIGQGQISSILVMMALAFVMSLCSTADAFVASTFILQFSSASVLAFLITGPMVDIKNTMMLFGSFNKKFVIRLIILILAVCFILAIIASMIMGGLYA